MRVLGIAGSLRRDSHNGRLLRAAAALLPPEVELVEFTTLKAFHAPAGAEALRITSGDPGCMVPATVSTGQGGAPGQFLFDTGNNGTLGLSRNFQDRHPELKFKPFAQSGARGDHGVCVGSDRLLLLDGRDTRLVGSAQRLRRDARERPRALATTDPRNDRPGVLRRFGAHMDQRGIA